MIAKLFIFIGKVGIVSLNCLTLVFMMKKVTMDMDEVDNISNPIIFVAVFTYIVSSILLSIYDYAVLSMMVCYGIDLDMHDGKTRYGPKTFHDSLIFQENEKK